MEIQLHNENGKARLTLSGRLDTVSAQHASTEIDRLLAESGRVDELVCDAGGVDYISSSGLRILIALAKRVPAFRISNVQLPVYSVLEMTGFTKIMAIDAPPADAKP